MLASSEPAEFEINPLSLLLKDEEVVAYYSMITSGKTEEKKKKPAKSSPTTFSQGDNISTFILNINYAGSETHQSAVNWLFYLGIVTRLVRIVYM